MKVILIMLLAALKPGLAAEVYQHPDSSGTNWATLFKDDLSDAIKPEGVWTVAAGVLTASQDEAIWTKQTYGDATIDLEFKTADGSNSGVIVYASKIKGGEWIPNSVEIQIADDYAKAWADKPRSWQCAAIFGRLAASRSAVKKPGEWNRMTIFCKGSHIDVVLNGEHVTSLDMKLWTDAKRNPDGSEIPGWLNRPLAELETRGHIGLQGKHAGAPIWFRNVRIRTD